MLTDEENAGWVGKVAQIVIMAEPLKEHRIQMVVEVHNHHSTPGSIWHSTQ